MKNQKGITLVALVVTIVVLLILAAVSIAMLRGDSGIISNAQKAKYANIEGEVIDKMNLAYNSVVTSIKVNEATQVGYKAVEHVPAYADEVYCDLVGNSNTLPFSAATGDLSLSTTDGYTVTYTSDDFGGREGSRYTAITAEITITGNNATYTAPVRQTQN